LLRDFDGLISEEFGNQKTRKRLETESTGFRRTGLSKSENQETRNGKCLGLFLVLWLSNSFQMVPPTFWFPNSFLSTSKDVRRFETGLTGFSGLGRTDFKGNLEARKP
jgi:hypothetical protein